MSNVLGTVESFRGGITGVPGQTQGGTSTLESSPGTVTFYVDIDAAAATPLSDVVGLEILPAPPAGSYYFITGAAAEYHYEGTSWVQTASLTLANASKTINYLYLPNLPLAGATNAVAPLMEYNVNALTATSLTSISVFGETGLMWSSATGDTFVRLRLEYSIFPF